MTIDREIVIRLAREADPGFNGGPDADGTLGDSLVGLAAIERFAALVLEHGRKPLTDSKALEIAAVAYDCRDAIRRAEAAHGINGARE